MIININIIIITMIVPLRATILITNHYSISSMNSGGGALRGLRGRLGSTLSQVAGLRVSRVSRKQVS